jgi:hypothetical protein
MAGVATVLLADDLVDDESRIAGLLRLRRRLGGRWIRIRVVLAHENILRASTDVVLGRSTRPFGEHGERVEAGGERPPDPPARLIAWRGSKRNGARR